MKNGADVEQIQLFAEADVLVLRGATRVHFPLDEFSQDTFPPDVYSSRQSPTLNFFYFTLFRSRPTDCFSLCSHIERNCGLIPRLHDATGWTTGCLIHATHYPIDWMNYANEPS